MNQIRRFLRDESGQDMMEFGLLAALVSIATILALHNIGPLVGVFYVTVQTSIPVNAGAGAALP